MEKNKLFNQIPCVEDLIEEYYKPEKTYHVNFQCSNLFESGLTKKDAEKKRDEWNEGKDWNPPAKVFEDDSCFPELYSDIYDDELKALLLDYIDRKKLYEK